MKYLLHRPLYCILLATTLIASMQLSAEDTADKLNDARMEGRIHMAYALNEHLSTFDLDIEVKGSDAVISGDVEDEVQKDLAEQVAVSIEGVESVDNQIKINDQYNHKVRSNDAGRSFRDSISDTTTTATVKSKLLWNGNTGGLDINVSTKNGYVTLEGQADSEASKSLAERLTANTDGVRSVDNNIQVTEDVESNDDDSRGVDDVVADTWITTKVRSSLIFTSNVPARSIGIETTDGVVSLDGKVDNETTKELAIEIASGIRGVKNVNAKKLVVGGKS